MKFTRWAPLLGLAALFNVSAADQIITLDDGRQIKLNSNFTWEYLPTTAQASPDAAEATAATATATTAAASQAPSTTATVVAAAPVSPVAVAANSNQLAGAVAFSPNQGGAVIQVQQSGVVVVIASPQWDGSQLVFPTEIRNNGLESAVEVDVTIEIYDHNGQILLKEEYPVWRSIKRMANTYLRPGQIEQGTPISAELTQAEHYQIRAQITDIDSRG